MSAHAYNRIVVLNNENKVVFEMVINEQEISDFITHFRKINVESDEFFSAVVLYKRIFEKYNFYEYLRTNNDLLEFKSEIEKYYTTFLALCTDSMKKAITIIDSFNFRPVSYSFDCNESETGIIKEFQDLKLIYLNGKNEYGDEYLVQYPFHPVMINILKNDLTAEIDSNRISVNIAVCKKYLEELQKHFDLSNYKNNELDLRLEMMKNLSNLSKIDISFPSVIGKFEDNLKVFYQDNNNRVENIVREIAAYLNNDDDKPFYEKLLKILNDFGKLSSREVHQRIVELLYEYYLPTNIIENTLETKDDYDDFIFLFKYYYLELISLDIFKNKFGDIKNGEARNLN